MSKQRIAFFFQHPYVETMPFIKEPIIQLAADGFQVDLFAPISIRFPKPNFESHNVRLYNMNFRSKREIPFLLWTVLKMVITRKYVLFIANPVYSLIYAAIAAVLSRVPLVTFSDELYTERDVKLAGHIRYLMNWAHQRATFSVITDMNRADVLRESVGLTCDHRFYELPNCPSGAPERVAREELRSKLCVPQSAILVLNLGAFLSAMGSRLLLNALPQLPDNIYLLFQEREILDFDILRLCKLVEERYQVRFLFNPLSYSAVDTVVQSCDMGVALYDSDGPNFRLCGKGSGKLCRYLRSGKPVIVNRRGGLEWVARCGAGEVVDSDNDLILAIQKIVCNYQSYSEKALQCYQEYFSLEKFYPPIRKEFQGVIYER